METLANELLVAIFADLTVKELLSCRRASRTWNRRILDLFSDRFIVIIHSRHLVKSGLENTFRKLIKDKVTPTFPNFGKQICFREFNHHVSLFGSKHKNKLIELKQSTLTHLPEAFSDVHTAIFDEITNFRYLCFFINNIHRLDSLTLAGFFIETSTERHLDLNADALQHLRSFNVSKCTFGLDDKTLLKLTSLMPNLAELNIATVNMVFYTGVIRRFYTSTDPDELIRQPTTFKLTFAAVRAALKHYITHLTTIRLCSLHINYDSIAHLLEYDSITNIYIEGTMHGDAELGEKMAELKKIAKTVEKNIHYTFCENPTSPE